MEQNDVYKYKGSFYKVLHVAKSKIPFREHEQVVVYQGDDGVYVRFLDEFKSKFKKVEGGE